MEIKVMSKEKIKKLYEPWVATTNEVRVKAMQVLLKSDVLKRSECQRKKR